MRISRVNEDSIQAQESGNNDLYIIETGRMLSHGRCASMGVQFPTVLGSLLTLGGKEMQRETWLETSNNV